MAAYESSLGSGLRLDVPQTNDGGEGNDKRPTQRVAGTPKHSIGSGAKYDIPRALNHFTKSVGPNTNFLPDNVAITRWVSREPEDPTEKYRPKPKRYEILKTWEEKFEDGDYTYFLNAVEKEQTEERLDERQVDWIHQQEDVKTHGNFKHVFSNYASAGLTEGMDRLTTGLLKRVQQNGEKPFLNRSYYNLTPDVVRYETNPLKNNGQPRPCTFLNFPYFSLHKPLPLPSLEPLQDAPSRCYPVQSLLQSRYRLERTETRDGKQCVTDLSNSEVNLCTDIQEAGRYEDSNRKCTEILHVPQVWCLSVSGEKLVTSAPMKDHELLGPRVLRDMGDRDSDDPDVNRGVTLVKIILSYGEHEQPWVYPVNHCDWWFALLSKRKEILDSSREDRHNGPADEEFFFFRRRSGGLEEEIRESDWVPLLNVLDGRLDDVELELWLKPRNKGTSMIVTPRSERILQGEEERVETESPATESPAGKISPSPNFQSSARDFANTTPQAPGQNRVNIVSHKLTYENIDRQHRIPFFEWSLRPQPKYRKEKERAERLKLVLHDIGNQFLSDYANVALERSAAIDTNVSSPISSRSEPARSSTKNSGVVSRSTRIQDMSRIKDIEGRTAADFKASLSEHREAVKAESSNGDQRFDQMIDIVGASSQLVSCFISRGVVFKDTLAATGLFEDEEVDPVHVEPLSGDIFERPEKVSFVDKKRKDDSTTVAQYRGILEIIILAIRDHPLENKDDQTLFESFQTIFNALNEIHVGVYSMRTSRQSVIAKTYSGAAILQRAMVRAFEELMFVHLGICEFCWQYAQSKKHGKPAQGLKSFIGTHVDKCCEQLQTSKNHLIGDASNQRIPELGAVVTSETVLILLLDRLSRGVRGPSSVDVVELYERIVEQLVVKVERQATRGLLISINKVTEELDIVRDVMKQQQKVLALLKYSLDPNTFSKRFFRSQKFEYESKAINNILKVVDDKLNNCDELRERVVRLAKQDVQLVDTKQDKNNQAILVFTIVTIIFLPFSTITGIFGMNLKGFNETTYDAGHFWKIAVPVTFGISAPCVFLALWGHRFEFFQTSRQKSRSMAQ